MLVDSERKFNTVGNLPALFVIQPPARPGHCHLQAQQAGSRPAQHGNAFFVAEARGIQNMVDRVGTPGIG